MGPVLELEFHPNHYQKLLIRSLNELTTVDKGVKT